MRHAAGQLPDRLHLAGLQQLLAGPLEHFLRLALGRDVAGDLGEADQTIATVADRFDDDARGKAAAVFAHTHPFGLDFSLIGRKA